MGQLIEDRFWKKVNVVKGNECWNWISFCNPKGYGMFRIGGRKGRMWLSHRVAWVLTHGDILDDLQVLHRCDNPPCVNPAHLYLGRNSDNIRDKVDRGRSSFSQPKHQNDKHWRAKLTNEQVQYIRSNYKGIKGEQLKFAQQYNVSRATICNILKNKSWKTV